MSSWGSPTGVTPELISARSYHSGSPSRSASSMTASRPIRCRTISGGTFPLRNPGTFISPAKLRAAACRRRSTSSGGTLAAIFTFESGRSVTSVLTSGGADMGREP